MCNCHQVPFSRGRASSALRSDAGARTTRGAFVAGLLSSGLAASALPVVARADDWYRAPLRELVLQRDATIYPPIAWTTDGRNLDPEGYLRLCAILRDDNPHIDLTRSLVRIDGGLLQVLWEIQQRVLQVDPRRVVRPIIVHSGYRTQVTNEDTPNAATLSMHVAGAACDFHIAGVRLAALRDIASNVPLIGGLGYYPRFDYTKQGDVIVSSLDQGWLHADVGPPRTWVA